MVSPVCHIPQAVADSVFTAAFRGLFTHCSRIVHLPFQPPYLWSYYL
jgi:hypothetical protein